MPSHICVRAVILAVAWSMTISLAGAEEQPRSQLLATVIANAPIYIEPKVLPIPLRTAAPGTRLEVLMEQGDWIQVRFGDPMLGPRVGWVQANLIRIERPELQPMDLSLPSAAARPADRAPTPTPDDERPPSPTAGRELAGNPETFGRSGFLVGFSVGPGFITCDDCGWTTGLALDFHIGGMVGTSIGLMYDNAATVVSVDDSIWSLDTMTFAVQGFTGRGWVKGGAGFSVASCADCFSVPIAEAGLALMGGAGGELVQRGRFAMDLQGRFTFNQFDGARVYTAMVTVGFNWY